MRLLVIILLSIGCAENKIHLKPQDTKFKESHKDWEYLYALELDSALKNEDQLAFYFFWPYYLEARYQNKCKKFNQNHEHNCSCKY